MRPNSYDRDLIGAGAVEPEYAVSGRSFILSISFKDFFAARATKRLTFVRVQGWIALVGLKLLVLVTRVVGVACSFQTIIAFSGA